MGSSMLDYVLNLWPFSSLRADDLKLSDKLVRRLSLPSHTKEFVYAIRVPENEAIVYILSAQNLSERSVWDVECLAREVQPDAIIALVGNNTLSQIYEHEMGEGANDQVPTSAFRFLMSCFRDKTNKDNYENLAGNLVLKEIFGVGFYGHFFVAKSLAEELGSSFFVIESPSMKSYGSDSSSSGPSVASSRLQALALQPASLAPRHWGSVVRNCQRFFITSDVQSQMVKLLSPSLSQSLMRASFVDSPVDSGSSIIEPRCNYCPPPFAQTIYPLFADLHDIFSDIPSMGRALAHAQKMFVDVGTGDSVDTGLLSEVYTFRIAVEGLRVALNNAGRLPMHKLRKHMEHQLDFQELSIEDKSHCLLAQTLRSQTKKFKTIVAVVDASNLAGLRMFWDNSVPEEVADVVKELVVCQEFGAESTNEKRKLFAKPVVAVASGATAVLGVSSFSKIPVSSISKLVMTYIPASLKLFITYTHKATVFAMSKILGPSKIVAPGFASSGAKASTAFKAAASAEKIRAVTHSLIASAEKTSLSTMRAAFYEIMRKRRVQPIRSMPWATFAFSVASCGGLLVYGDGIECAAESLPAAPSIASLGRGIQNLQEASQSLGESCRQKMQKAIEPLIDRFKQRRVY